MHEPRHSLEAMTNITAGTVIKKREPTLLRDVYYFAFRIRAAFR
jgi:hypothetical protein